MLTRHALRHDQQVVRARNKLERRKEIGHRAGDPPYEPTLAKHVVDVTTRFATRRDLDVRYAHEVVERQSLADTRVAFANCTHEAVSEKLPTAHFLWKIAIDADREIDIAFPQHEPVVLGVRQEPERDVRRLLDQIRNPDRRWPRRR